MISKTDIMLRKSPTTMPSTVTYRVITSDVKTNLSKVTTATNNTQVTKPILRAPIGSTSSCEDDSIETVSEGSEILIMLSGVKYQVAPRDEASTATWLATEDVVICNDETVVNKDENGKKLMSLVSKARVVYAIS